MKRTVYRHEAWKDGEQRVSYSTSVKAKDNNGEDKWVWIRVFFPKGDRLPVAKKFSVDIDDFAYSFNEIRIGSGDKVRQYAAISCMWINEYTIGEVQHDEPDAGGFEQAEIDLPF